MRSKSFIAALGLLVVLGALTGGLALYDSSRADEIAPGITVSGVDVGGMERAAAREKLRAEVAEPLQEPLVARYRGRRFTLTPERARVTVDVERSVDAAVSRSRRGNFVSRSLRGLSGHTVDADLEVNVDYDRGAVSALVKRVRERLDKPAVDADVNISTSGIETESSRRGLEVNTRALSRSVRRKLVSATAERRVTIRARKLKPQTTTDELADKYSSVIVVDRGAFTLRLYENLEPAQDYTIAVGQAGYETPTGLYDIQTKQVNPYWNVPTSGWAGSLAGQTIPPGPSNPLKSRWMGIYNGAGIHGTDDIGSLGTAASHGCIRMAVPDVEALYERVDIGTPVYVG